MIGTKKRGWVLHIQPTITSPFENFHNDKVIYMDSIDDKGKSKLPIDVYITDEMNISNVTEKCKMFDHVILGGIEINVDYISRSDDSILYLTKLLRNKGKLYVPTKYENAKAIPDETLFYLMQSTKNANLLYRGKTTLSYLDGNVRKGVTYHVFQL